MILNLVDRRGGADGASQEFHGQKWQRLCRLVAELGGVHWPVDVVLVDDEAIVDLNTRFRGKDGVTDVLSFSYLEFEGSGEPDLLGKERYAAADIWLPNTPASDEAVGELVLAPAFIAERCLANSWPLELEIPMLVVHGCLHLLGWDHEDVEDSKRMQDMEVTILAPEGLSHPLRQRS